MHIDLPQEMPFIYKQLAQEAFGEHYSYKVDDIDVTAEGYLGNYLLDIVLPDLLKPNTVVINCGVGQGKSYSVIQIVKEYLLRHPDEIIPVIAVPYLSLIPQYNTDLKEALADVKIFNYSHLESYSEQNPLNLAEFDAHILTVNGLLQNPGETAIFQNAKKSEYFTKLRKHCETSGKKLVIFYDEMHAAVSNFGEDNIISLWNFKDHILKNFIVSATFNEASVVVIQYLAEFTAKEIHMIQSKRKRIDEKRSKLKLIIDDLSYASPSSDFVKLMQNIKECGTPFDIIHFSKATSIKIKSSLEEQGFEESTLHLSSGESEVKYDHTKNNIGTSFSTGVSIKKQDHSLIIFLPPASLKVKHNAGIFTGGSDIIIQALARQRTPGKIFVFISTPLLVRDHPFTDFPQIDHYQSLFCDVTMATKYFHPAKAREFLEKMYKQYMDTREVGIRILSHADRPDMNSLRPKSFALFVLENSEMLLNSRHFDGCLSTFTFFTAITDNFLNCNLEHVVSSNTLSFSSDNLAQEIRLIYSSIVLGLSSQEEYVSGDLFNQLNLEILHNFATFLSKRSLRYDQNKANASNLVSIYLTLLRLLGKGSISKIEVTELDQKKLIPQYILSNMQKAVKSENIDFSKYPSRYRELAKHYKILNDLREMTKKSFTTIGERTNLSQSLTSIPNSIDLDPFFNSLSFVMENDPILKLQIKFSNSYNSKKNNLPKLKTWFYSTFILETFSKRRVMSNTYYQMEDLQCNEVNSIFDLTLEPFYIFEDI